MFETSWIYTSLYNGILNSQVFILGKKAYDVLNKTWVNSLTHVFVMAIYNFFVKIVSGSVFLNLLFIGEPQTLKHTENSLLGRAVGVIYKFIHGLTQRLGKTINNYFFNSFVYSFFKKNVMLGVIIYLLLMALSYKLNSTIFSIIPWLGIGALIALYVRIELGIFYLVSFIPVNLALLDYEIIPSATKYTVELILAVMLMIVLYKIFFTEKIKLQLSDLDFPLIGIFVVGILSAIVNEVDFKIAIFGMRAFMQFSLLYLIIAQLKPSREDIKKFLVFLLLFATIIASIGIGQRIMGITTPIQWVDASELNNVTMRAFSTMSNPNTFAGYLILFIPIALAFTLAPIHMGLRVLALLATGIMSVALLFTYSRGAMLGLGAGMLMLGLIYNKRLLALVIAGAMALPIVAPSIITRILYGFSADYIAKSLNYGRLLFWSFGFQLLEKHPWLGVGPGRFGGSIANIYGSPAYREIGLPLDYEMWVDSQIMQVWTELGTLGLIVFLWLIFNYFKNAFTAYKLEKDVVTKTFIAGAIASFVGFMVQSAVASIWEIHQIATFAWLMIGLVTAIRIRQKNEQK